jgi:cholesterol oxidase
MTRAGHAVKFRPGDPKYRALPDDYLEYAREIETPVLLVTGRSNNIFTNSQLETHRTLEELGGTNTEVHVFETYGHQDVFMGKDVAKEVFPRFLSFLRENSRSRSEPTRAGEAVAAPSS